MWTHTADHSDRFYQVANDISSSLQCQPLHLLGAGNAESGMSAKAENPRSSATGILQWMQVHWQKWGFTRAQFAALPADEQIQYALKYLAPFKGALTSSAAIYTAVFLPAFVHEADDPTYVLCARGEKLGWAYSANAVFDADGDGRITVGELDDAIHRNWTGPRCAEMLARAGITDAPAWATPDPEDLRTTFGVQRVLSRLGYDLGPSGVDGMPGTFTRLAVVHFQQRSGLVADGLVGPNTRAALLAA